MKTMTRPQGTAHVEHALTQLAARFQDWRYGTLHKLLRQPVLESVHYRATILLMVLQAHLSIHMLHARLFLMIEHLPEGVDHPSTARRKSVYSS